jgi:Zn-dependent protease with chaperone function
MVAATAHAHPLVDQLVDKLEINLSTCTAAPASDPQRQLVEADIAAFRKAVSVPAGVAFEVHDCPMDGFVLKGQTIVLSSRLARLSAPQRFFIIAHELGHQRLQHRQAIGNFFSQVVGGSDRDALAVLANNSSGLTELSHRSELDADAFAVKTMFDAGMDAEDAARLFDSLGPGADNGTHPSFSRRAKAIRSLHAVLLAEDSPVTAAPR